MKSRMIALVSALLLTAASAALAQPEHRQASGAQHPDSTPHAQGPASQARQTQPHSSRSYGGEHRIPGAGQAPSRAQGLPPSGTQGGERRSPGPGQAPSPAPRLPQQRGQRPASPPATPAQPRVFAPSPGSHAGRSYAPPQASHRAPPSADGRYAGPHWRPDRYPHSFTSQRRYYGPTYHPPRGFDFRVWRFGDILPSIWWSSEYRIWDWWTYDLPAPPPGYVWIRSGLDALLVDPTGRVVQVVSMIFW